MLQNQAKIITSMLEKLKATPDFYVEIKWEFTSWCELSIPVNSSFFSLMVQIFIAYFYAYAPLLIGPPMLLFVHFLMYLLWNYNASLITPN